jgi:HJR/Mrr/RecB family endonuclease
MFWDDRVSNLVEHARGDSVTENRLTKTGARVFGTSYLNEEPILYYLEPDEQPQYIFYNATKGVTLYLNGVERHIKPNMAYASYAVLSDWRVIVIVPTDQEDILCGANYDSIHSARFQTGKRQHQMDFATADDGITFYINPSISSIEIAEARDFVMPRLTGEKTSGSLINADNFNIVNERLNIGIDVEQFRPDDMNGGPQIASSRVAEHKSPDSSEVHQSELINKLRSLDAYSFEELVADLWTERGWNAVATTESGDRGIDVIAERQDPIPEKQLIQVKKYAEGNTVGSRDIQQYSSLRHQQNGVDAVVVVTTSTFTKQARELAENLNVKLVDIDLLCELIRLENAYDIVRWHAGERTNKEDDTGTTDDKPDEFDAVDEMKDIDKPDEMTESPEENAGPDPIEEIRRVRDLWDEGILTESEFESKKQELLDRI